MKLTDGKRTIEIQMMTWEGNGYTPDWSKDFFEAGDCPYDEENDVYIVKDVDYCIEQAEDWKNGRGDFYNPDIEPNPNNEVIVTEL